MVYLPSIPTPFSTNCRRIGGSRKTLKPRFILAIMGTAIIFIYVPVITVIMPQQLSVPACFRADCSSIVKLIIRVITRVTLKGIRSHTGKAPWIALLTVKIPGIRFFALRIASIVVIMITVLASCPISYCWMLKLVVPIEWMTIRFFSYSMPHRYRVLSPVVKLNFSDIPMEVLLYRVVSPDL